MGERTTRPEVHVLCCHAGALTEPDLRTVEALARLQLVARRHGIALRFCHVPPALEELLALAGLDAVVPCGDVPPEASAQQIQPP